MPFPAVPFAGVRIGELIVTVVGERQVAGATFVELFDAGDILAERVAVLDSHERRFFACCMNFPDVAGGQRQFHCFTGNITGEAMNRLELFDGKVVSALVTGGFERVRILRFPCLADINDEKQRIEPAVDHVG